MQATAIELRIYLPLAAQDFPSFDPSLAFEADPLLQNGERSLRPHPTRSNSARS